MYNMDEIKIFKKRSLGGSIPLISHPRLTATDSISIENDNFRVCISDGLIIENDIIFYRMKNYHNILIY